jgi:hypothetical protein
LHAGGHRFDSDILHTFLKKVLVNERVIVIRFTPLGAQKKRFETYNKLRLMLVIKEDL